MSQSKGLVKTLKQVLKQQGKTYKELAEFLELSEASVKRLFSEHSFSLERLEKVCEFAQIEISDLVEIMQESQDKISSLSFEQEKELVRDLKLLLVANCLLNHWTFEQIVETYQVEDLEGIQLLAKLDRMKIIQLLPGNRVKIMVSRNFGWLEHGPIQQFYEQSVQADFFKTSFTGPGEFRIFLNGMLSRASNQTIKNRSERLAQEFNQLHAKDQQLSLDERFGTSLILAMRPWELEVFSKLRRQQNHKFY
jgi:DNA-binding Xre family transcriptional regulator